MKDAAIPKRLLEAAASARPLGYLEDVLSHVTSEDDTYVYMPRGDYLRLAKKYAGSPSPQVAGGPGTELKRLLSLLGIHASPGCSCTRRAELMDANGVTWCEANIDTITGWLREEARKRGLPFVDLAARLLIRRAIRNARLAATA